MDPLAVAQLLRTNRPLGALVVANGLSAMGNWLYMTVVPIVVYTKTGDASLVGLIMAARLLPWLLLSVPAGILADRVPRRRLLMVVEAASAMLMFAMAAVYVIDAPTWALVVLALAAVTVGTFAMPVHGTLAPDLARNDDELGIANVLSSAMDNLASVAGPALAAALVLIGNTTLAFAINGVSFLVILVWLALLPNDSKVARVHKSQGEGDRMGAVRHWRSLVLRSAPRLAIDGAVSFAAGAMAVLVVLVSVAVDDGGVEASIALLNTAAGVGAVGGAFIAARFINRTALHGLTVGVLAIVISFVALAGSAALPAAALATAGITGALVLLEVLNMTELQRSTDSGELGRVLGLLHSLAAGWMIAGSLVAGLAAAVLGPTATILVCASVVVVLGFAGMAMPKLQTMRTRGRALAGVHP